MPTPSLSFILPAAREDYPITGLPDLHCFEVLRRSLESQSVKDFELIHVDNLHQFRPGWWKDKNPSFPVTHIPVKPGSWSERGRCNLSAAYNTGLVHANGEYVCILNDCGEFPPWMVEVLLEHLRAGRRPQVPLVQYYAGHPKLTDGSSAASRKAVDEMSCTPTDRRDDWLSFHLTLPPDDVHADARYTLVRKKAGPAGWMVHDHHEWFWPYPAAPLEDFLAVNGYDEFFDATKALDDCDIGWRMWRHLPAAQRVLDRRLWFIQHWDDRVSMRVFPYLSHEWKSNVPLFYWTMRSDRVRANDGPLPPEAEKFFRTPPGQNDGLYYYQKTGEWSTFWKWDDPEFRLWWEHPPKFDLREQRRRRLEELVPW